MSDPVEDTPLDRAIAAAVQAERERIRAGVDALPDWYSGLPAIHRPAVLAVIDGKENSHE